MRQSYSLRCNHVWYHCCIPASELLFVCAKFLNLLVNRSTFGGLLDFLEWSAAKSGKVSTKKKSFLICFLCKHSLLKALLN